MCLPEELPCAGQMNLGITSISGSIRFTVQVERVNDVGKLGL